MPWNSASFSSLTGSAAHSEAMNRLRIQGPAADTSDMFGLQIGHPGP